MKSTGIVRKVDELGRIVLPIELRRIMGLNEKDPIEIFIDESAGFIMLRKYRTRECLFCNSVDELTYFRERFVCRACLQVLNPGAQVAEREVAAATLEEAEEPKRNKPRGDTVKRLADVMASNPGAKQTEWARMLGVSPSRVNQLIHQQSSSGKKSD